MLELSTVPLRGRSSWKAGTVSPSQSRSASFNAGILSMEVWSSLLWCWRLNPASGLLSMYSTTELHPQPRKSGFSLVTVFDQLADLLSCRFEFNQALLWFWQTWPQSSHEPHLNTDYPCTKEQENGFQSMPLTKIPLGQSNHTGSSVRDSNEEWH